ncbi:MAG: capsule biosynthesis protein CapK [Azoarcus sp.]|nr:capsule biosynthesis protein CapK [Azoarcus sp.]
MLNFLREHPAAPRYRNQSGNRLLAPEIEALRGFEREVGEASVGWPPENHPSWLKDYVKRVFEDVPHFRRLGSPPGHFADIPTTTRADLATDIAQFVPDSVPIDRLINFRTTGTTGHPLLIASHPLVAGRYLAFHKRALRRFGIELRHGRGEVGVVLLGMQKKCFTYVSVTPLMEESGLAKINLHPDDWRDPDDRVRYLDALQPEIIAGDPISFAELLTLPLAVRPRAIFSVGMTLLPGLRQLLEERFACPVLDFYSMNEAGPIGIFDAAAGGHVLLQNRLYIEILNTQGQPVAEGERGEIALTGGFNFCLPLLRYRSGDFAALSRHDGEPVLSGLCGREPVRFRNGDGAWINNIDVTHALQSLPLRQFGLHQNADGSLVLRLGRNDMAFSEAAAGLLRPLFDGQSVAVEEITTEGKILQYTSDFEKTSA